jgi:hypothetical protein
MPQRLRGAVHPVTTRAMGSSGSAHNGCAMEAYNQQQWVDSFEGRLSIQRPHLTQRVLDTMSLSAWQLHGTHGEDPITLAKAWSAALSQPNQ